MSDDLCHFCGGSHDISECPRQLKARVPALSFDRCMQELVIAHVAHCGLQAMPPKARIQLARELAMALEPEAQS